MSTDMDLGQDIINQVGDVLELSAEPAKREPVTCTVEYVLLPEHLAEYAEKSGELATTQKAAEKDVVALRARHHGVARLLAEGVPEGVIAEMTGYTTSHISVLKNTPAMIELVSFYRQPKNETARIIGEKLRTAADMSLELIVQRLAEKPDEISISELKEISKLGFDRSGHGPTSTVNNVTEHRIVGAEELLELSRDARRRERSRIVDVSVVRNVLPAPEEKQDEGREQRSGRLPDTGADSSGDGTGA